MFDEETINEIIYQYKPEQLEYYQSKLKVYEEALQKQQVDIIDMQKSILILEKIKEFWGTKDVLKKLKDADIKEHNFYFQKLQENKLQFSADIKSFQQYYLDKIAENENEFNQKNQELVKIIDFQKTEMKFLKEHINILKQTNKGQDVSEEYLQKMKDYETREKDLKDKLKLAVIKIKQLQTQQNEPQQSITQQKADNDSIQNKQQEQEQQQQHRVSEGSSYTLDDMKKKLVEAAKKMITLKKQIEEKDNEILQLKEQLNLRGIQNNTLDQEIQNRKITGNINKLQQNWQAKCQQKMKPNIQQLKQQVYNLKNELNQFKYNMTQSMNPLIQNLVQVVQSNGQNQFQALQQKYIKEMLERKKLYNEIQELKGNIRVFCRIRPLSKSEKDSCISPNLDEDSITVTQLDTQDIKKFDFDKVFDVNSVQQEVFNEVQPLITSILDGYSVCIFAYGQTGSGKTYTMQGPSNDPGVYTRTINELYKVIGERSENYAYKLQISLLEIYNEQIRDLLNQDQSVKLEIKQGPNGNYVPDLTTISVNGPQEVHKYLEIGVGNRAVGNTDMNAHSSRSHLVYTIYIQGINKVSNKEFSGKLHLVDLAGSERIAKTGVQGQAQKESIAINKSLTALGDVISSRVEKKSHIPYRNSELTYFLQDSLSGDAKTLMILQLSPAFYSHEETLCSCKFASRARAIDNTTTQTTKKK